MMMIIITRYPASEDRLIVRPLLSRVCALRLQPAEPQPYRGSQREIPQAPHRAYVTDLRSYPTNLDAVNTKKTRKGTAVLPPEELLYDLLRKYLWRNAFELSTQESL